MHLLECHEPSIPFLNLPSYTVPKDFKASFSVPNAVVADVPIHSRSETSTSLLGLWHNSFHKYIFIHYVVVVKSGKVYPERLCSQSVLICIYLLHTSLIWLRVCCHKQATFHSVFTNFAAVCHMSGSRSLFQTLSRFPKIRTLFHLLVPVIP